MEQVLQRVAPIEAGGDCPVTNSYSGYLPKTTLGRAVLENIGTTNLSGATQTKIYRPRTFIGRAILGDAIEESGPSDAVDSPSSLSQYGSIMAGRLLGAGKSHREVAEILVGTASAFVANTATAVRTILTFSFCFD